MYISSTEFQQNVGFYLREAEKGKTIKIRRLKPNNVEFSLLVSKRNTGKNNQVERNKLIKDLISNLKIDDPNEQGLEFQNTVRT